MQQNLRVALAKILRRAEEAETTWACIAKKPGVERDCLSSLKELADLVDGRIVAAVNERDAMILPLLAKVDHQRMKINAVCTLMVCA